MLVYYLFLLYYVSESWGCNTPTFMFQKHTEEQLPLSLSLTLTLFHPRFLTLFLTHCHPFTFPHPHKRYS